MEIKCFVFSFFEVNTYVVWDPRSREAAIVDPAMLHDNEVDILKDFIRKNDLTVKYIVATHLHLDHCFGIKAAEEAFGVGLWANEEDAFLGELLSGQAQMFGMKMQLDPVKIDHEIEDGSVLNLGEEELVVLRVPGHSPGSVALYCPQSHFVITGDALFNGSIGRTDLPGGNHQQLLASVRDKLLPLPPDTKVYPGHGPATTIAAEARSNPFL